MEIWKFLSFVGLTGILVSKGFQYWNWMKFSKVVFFNHQNGPCQYVVGIENGSEDIDVLANGLAFISAGLIFPPSKIIPGKTQHTGAMLTFDFNNSNTSVRKIPIKWSGEVKNDFNPHGISLWQEDEKILLFVISHDNVGEAVERFQFDQVNHQLIHLETIRNNGFHVLNDLTATGERTFYFTNFWYFKNNLLSRVEVLAMLNLGTVGYYDGKYVRYVVNNIFMPNGISQSPDGRLIYLAIAGFDELRQYRIESNDDLKHEQTLSLNTAVDNMNVDPDTGDIWCGCHPARWKLSQHVYLGQKQISSPSQVLRIKVRNGFMDASTISEVFLDNGDKISGSSVAVAYRGKYLIGTILRNAMLCEIGNSF